MLLLCLPKFLSIHISSDSSRVFADYIQQGIPHKILVEVHIAVLHLNGEVVFEHDDHQRLPLISETCHAFGNAG